MAYLFSSERLGFRPWSRSDEEAFYQLNSNESVMRHFPAPLSKEENIGLLERLMQHQENHSFSFFAVEEITSGQLVGMLGLIYTNLEEELGHIEVGWRLFPQYWGKGLATEGALRCLSFAFDEILAERVIAFCPAVNLASEMVMKRLGMSKVRNFTHPKLLNETRLKSCVLYQIMATEYSV